jgi:hypothetical protein
MAGPMAILAGGIFRAQLAHDVGGRVPDLVEHAFFVLFIAFCCHTFLQTERRFFSAVG